MTNIIKGRFKTKIRNQSIIVPIESFEEIDKNFSFWLRAGKRLNLVKFTVFVLFVFGLVTLNLLVMTKLN